MTTDKKDIWRQKLAQSRQSLLALLNSLTPAQWDAPVFSENDTWTVATVISHLVDAERGMSIHVHRIRKGEPTVPEGFDIERWNAGLKQRVGNPSPAELLASLESTRAKTLEGLASVQDTEWALTGRHPARGVITIEQYYETIAGHEVVHAQDIQKALGLNH